MSIKKEDVKKFWKKFWFLLWKDDSFKGWLFSVIFLVIFILFILFPMLRLTTGTALPLAIVESCSMYHQNNLFSNFDNWWKDHQSNYFSFDIEKKEFENFIFKKGFNKGDILFILGVKPEKVKQGDVIIFNANKQNPIIHRVVKIQKTNETYIFSTMGDNNPGQLEIEKRINQDQIVGKAVLKLAPYAGWIKLIFYEHLKNPQERGFCNSN